MAEGAVSVECELDWQEEMRFAGHSGAAALVLDGAGQAGPSPVQALALALAGCMAMDLVHILTKGRFAFRGLSARLRGERAGEDPRRLVKVALHFVVRGDVPPEKVERALALSREKYCSVWHSLRTDIALSTTFDISA